MSHSNFHSVPKALLRLLDSVSTHLDIDSADLRSTCTAPSLMALSMPQGSTMYCLWLAVLLQVHAKS